MRLSCCFKRLSAQSEDNLPVWIRLSPSRWVLLAAVALPLAELAAFIAVVVKIGLLGALALVLATSCLGIFLLRRAGNGQIAQIRVSPTGGVMGATGGSGVFLALSGILLVLPGFLTDAMGLALLLPPVQRGVRAALGRVLRQEPDGRGGGPADRDSVVDLAPDEWREADPPDRDAARDQLPKP